MPIQLADLLTSDRTRCCVKATSKKRALEVLAEVIAGSRPELSQQEVFDSLIARERLGSTGLGAGVAIPHGRVKGNQQAVGAFLQLAEPIGFDAIDGKPVDLLFGLIVPENSTEEHLQLLAFLAEMFSGEALRVALREARDGQTLYGRLVDWRPGGRQ